jgi:hypothetical protein
MDRGVRGRVEIAARVGEEGWTRIGGAEWRALRETFPAISEATLRRYLEALGLPVEQPWRGVDTSSLETVEASLNAMAAVYPNHPREARAVVIAAKDKTHFAARNVKAAAEKRALKSEMVDWMLVWLGDPAMFADWARLRRNYLAANPAKPTLP